MIVHFIAIGGSGMSAVAELLIDAGHTVQGSDQAHSYTLDHLRDRGATVYVGHDAAHIEGADLVVVSSAIRDSNVELAAARAAGIPVIHRSQGLVLAAGERPFIAVAGSHGKTTTSGMLAMALTKAGLDPSFALGSVVEGLGVRAHLATGPFVAEADESDGSFLNYSTRVALVTNVEPDHLFHYGSVEAVEQAFVDFSENIIDGGLLVACADDDGSWRLAEAARAAGTRVRTYGTDPRADVRIEVTDSTPVSSEAVIHAGGSAYPLTLHVPGLHNLLNAVGAWCVGVDFGVEPAAMAEALGSFAGTKRRFETIGIEDGVRVVDDYAHHPTEVEAVLGMARQTAGEGRVIMVFQPHLYSRTRDFAEEFGEALSLADEVVLLPIDGAREDPVEGVTSALIESHVRTSLTSVDGAEADGNKPAGTAAAVEAVAQIARDGDIVITSGCGTVTALAPVIVDALAARG